MKTFTHLWQYLAEFFLERETFRTKVVEKIKTLNLRSITFLRKSCRLRQNVEQYSGAREAADDNMASRVAYWLSKQAHARARALTHTHTHTHRSVK